MTRDYSRRNVDIWGDPDMRALPFPAQYLYNVLWDHPKLSYCGSLDWRPGKIAQLADGLTPALVKEFAACLQARYFVIVDEDTEEALLRSWVRFDGLMKQPRLAVSFVSAYAELGSNNLRAVAVDELAKLREREPDLAGFKDKRVLDILGFPRTPARDLPTPSDPFGRGFAFTLGKGLGQIDPKVWVPPTPSPTPTPISYSQEELCASADADALFDEFWDAFNHKFGKQRARTNWNKAIKKTDPQAIIAGARRWARHVEAETARDPRFKPKWAEGWLTEQRWEDELGSSDQPPEQRGSFAPPPLPEGAPQRLFVPWNRAHRDAWLAGQTGPSDWHELEQVAS